MHKFVVDFNSFCCYYNFKIILNYWAILWEKYITLKDENKINKKNHSKCYYIFLDNFIAIKNFISNISSTFNFNYYLWYNLFYKYLVIYWFFFMKNILF